MSANIKKNGLINGSAITDYDKASILKDNITVNSNLLPSTLTGCTGGKGTTISNAYGGFTARYLKYESTSFSDDISVGNFITPKASTYYTVSFWAKGNCKIICYFYPSTVASGVSSTGTTTTAGDGAIVLQLTNTWKRYWITWKTTSSVSGAKSTVLGRISNQGTGAECYIAGVKFEESSVATPWCPYSTDSVTGFSGSSNIPKITNPIKCNDIYEI